MLLRDNLQGGGPKMKLSTSREGQSLEGYHSTSPILKKMQDALCVRHKAGKHSPNLQDLS